MNKLLLIPFSLFLITTVYGQEQHSERIKHQKTTKDVKKVQTNEDKNSKEFNFKTTNKGKKKSNEKSTYNSNNQSIRKEHKELEDFSSETIREVKRQLKELYGMHYEQYGANRIAFYAAFYERCEFIPLSEAPSNIPNISSLNIIDKYNPSEVNQINNLENFDQTVFNVFKYRFNLYKETDLYYRIYNTNRVLRIKALKH